MRRLIVTAAALSSLLLAACAAPMGGDTPSGPAITEEVAQRGGTMQFAASRPPHTLYYYEAQGIDASITLGPVWDPLVEYEFIPGQDWQIDHKIAPALAESWKVVSDTAYEFKLRSGARWHDGQEVTVDDVVWSFETMRSSAKPTRVAGVIKDLDTIQATDRSTIRMTTKQPSAEFLYLIASSSAQVKILPKHIADKGLSFDEHPIGSGAFKMQSFERLSKAVLARNETYWRDGPYMDKVNIIYGLDTSARLAAFISRNNDVINVGDQVQFDTISSSVPGVLSEVAPGNYNYGMYPKIDQPPFNDVRVRRAMHLAIDRQAMIETLTFGKGVINPPGIAGSKTGWALSREELEKLPGYRQPKQADIAEAKKLLADAGYPNGFKTSLTLNNGIITVVPVSEMLAGQLKTIGIEATLKPQEPAVWQKSQQDGNFEILMLNSGNMLPDRNLHSYFHTKGILNSSPVRDATIDRLVEAQTQELDVEKRKKLIQDFQRHMLDQLYHIPAIDLGFFAAWHPYVKNYVFNFGAQPYLVAPHMLWLDQKNLPPGR